MHPTNPSRVANVGIKRPDLSVKGMRPILPFSGRAGNELVRITLHFGPVVPMSYSPTRMSESVGAKRQRTQQKAPQAVLRKRTFTQRTANATELRPGAYNRLMFVEDAKLPQDVVRKQYSDARDALCCLDCGFEWDFDPTVQDSIGRPLYVLVMHDCKVDGD